MARDRFDAVLLDGADYFVRNDLRLVIVDRDRRAVLGRDGLWHEDPEAAPLPAEEVGIVIPRAAVDAIAEAIARWGGAGDARTEAKVLREWLAVERGRVDVIINAGG